MRVVVVVVFIIHVAGDGIGARWATRIEIGNDAYRIRATAERDLFTNTIPRRRVSSEITTGITIDIRNGTDGECVRRAIEVAARP